MSSPFDDFDVASTIWKGSRPYQEDSLSTDFHAGLPHGFAIIADGMGGHAAGDVASNLAVAQGVGHLKLAMQNAAEREKDLPGDLRTVIDKANEAIAERISQDVRVAGMGTTMLALAVMEERLYWGSVGDSPLFLVRDGELSQLNQDHSMAPVIAAMVERGELTAEQGKSHPDRNALTSVLMGERIEKSDVPQASFEMQADDLLIAASDGLQFLDNERILQTVMGCQPASSAQICQALLGELKTLDDPHQDNVAIIVIQRRGGSDQYAQKARTAASDVTKPADGPQDASATPSAEPRPRTRILTEVSPTAAPVVSDAGGDEGGEDTQGAQNDPVEAEDQSAEAAGDQPAQPPLRGLDSPTMKKATLQVLMGVLLMGVILYIVGLLLQR